LLSLFSLCPVCDQQADVKTHTVGTLLCITQSCEDCEYYRSWKSQPIINNAPAGNLLLSAAILFTGAQPTKTLRVLDCLACASITRATFYNYQKWYLQPAIFNVWNQQQTNMIQVLQALGEPLSLGGDGRSDSPGHCAKYGSYSLMDLEHNVILDVELAGSGKLQCL
jgi:solute carrier family 8 (sodium/calcium exchanger)